MMRFSPEQTKWLWSGSIIFIILVGIYLVLSFPLSVFDHSVKIHPVTHYPPGESRALSEPDNASVSTDEMENFILSLKNTTPGHDPFLSSGEQDWKNFLNTLKDQPPHLDGIIRVENQRVALIQSSRFREGEEVSGFLIVKINDKSVLLSKEGKTYIITLD
ncbi:MAG TPA: hypothetical protein VJ624_03490 [Thermodesulfobacteriota bacterium]|nr:hypothetical protein [Thermodesulfobacteriota bacterium]